jgi:cytochrome b pre-mRNA-processing protein 3
MIFSRLFFRGSPMRGAHAAYTMLVERARSPCFYAAHGIPDTLDGRFELIALHAFLVLHRIRGEASAQPFGQALFDAMFGDMDRALRELGTGDLSVGKQVKRMATGFYGRISVYQAGIAGTEDLGQALIDNLFGTVEQPDRQHVTWFADYLWRETGWLRTIQTADIVVGNFSFGPLPPDA